MKFVLCGDIGGTNVNLAVVSIGKNIRIVKKKSYSSKKINDFNVLVNEFLKETKHKITDACFGAAGAVSVDRTKVKITHASWKINTKDILRKTKLKRVLLLNDFESLAYGVRHMSRGHYVQIPHSDGSKSRRVETSALVIGAGTGLGINFYFYDENLATGTEGGHATLLAQTDEDLDYVKSLGRYPRLEQVLSGPGIVSMYKFFSKKYGKSKEVEKQKTEIDKIGVILKEKDKASKKTISMFMRYYAIACKSLALTIVSRGGVYIAGGLAKALLHKFDKKWIKFFEGHRYYGHLLKSIPVYVIRDPVNVSLLGCGNFLSKGI